MNSSLVDYKLACSDQCYDIYAFTETWINENTPFNLLFDDTYSVYRQDRSPSNSNKRSGGGVLLAIRSCFKSRQMFIPEIDVIEQLWVSVSLSEAKTFICVVYFPPDRVNDVNLIEKHVESINWIIGQMSPNDNIIIVGDFNLRFVNWNWNAQGFYYPDVAHSSGTVSSGCLLDGYSTACLRQLNGVKNDNGRTLDLCFVSDEMCAHCNITRAPSMLVKVCRHHPPLQLSIKTNTKFAFEDAEVSTLFYDFGSADFDSMNSFLMNVHWAEVLRDCDADRSASIVSNILLYAIDQSVPKKLNRVIAHPAWSNSHLKRLKREKRKALRKFSKHKLHHPGHGIYEQINIISD